MADSFIALYCFHGMFVHGVVKLSFSNKFFSDRWLLNTRKRTFPCSGVQTSLVKRLPGYQANVLYRSPPRFSFKFRWFLSTVGLSNEDNCCKSQEIGKLIKEKP